MRISLELSSANPKVILITSALPAEGKSTAAMLLAASSASSGKRTILLDCDLRLRSVSEALGNKHQPGLSELLRGTAKLTDVITQDPVTKIYVLPAGSMAPNAADLLMSQEMLDLIAILRGEFDYIVMDAPPLLPVVDALALATAADKILVIVEWCETSRASIHEAFRVLGPEVNRVAGIVLNKVDFNQLPGYRRPAITIAQSPSTSATHETRLTGCSTTLNGSNTVRWQSTIGYLSPVEFQERAVLSYRPRNQQQSMPESSSVEPVSREVGVSVPTAIELVSAVTCAGRWWRNCRQ